MLIIKSIYVFVKKIWLYKLGKQYSQLGIIVTTQDTLAYSKIISTRSLFQGQIEPILMYGSEILFSAEEISDFEMVHLSCILKNMIMVKQQTTSVTIDGDSGGYPFFKQKILALKYWNPLICLTIVYNTLPSLVLT